jgi:hypothetical protein
VLPVEGNLLAKQHPSLPRQGFLKGLSDNRYVSEGENAEGMASMPITIFLLIHQYFFCRKGLHTRKGLLIVIKIQ